MIVVGALVVASVAPAAPPAAGAGGKAWGEVVAARSDPERGADAPATVAPVAGEGMDRGWRDGLPDGVEIPDPFTGKDRPWLLPGVDTPTGPEPAAAADARDPTRPGRPVPLSPTASSGSRDPHPPIIVQGDDGFATCACVRDGSGSAQDPYLIARWRIELEEGQTGITLRNTTAHVVIRDNLVTGLEGGARGMREGTTAMMLDNATHVTVRSNVLTELFRGIVSAVPGDRPTDVTIVGNRLEGFESVPRPDCVPDPDSPCSVDVGILVHRGRGTRVADNVLHNVGAWDGGIRAVDVSETVIEGNELTHAHGIAVSGRNLTVRNNTLQDVHPELTAEPRMGGIQAFGDGIEILDNAMSGTSWIDVSRPPPGEAPVRDIEQVRIEGNRISDSAGIKVRPPWGRRVSDVTVRDNVVSGGGIIVERTARTDVTNNTVRTSIGDWGILVDDSSGASVRGNDVSAAEAVREAPRWFPYGFFTGFLEPVGLRIWASGTVATGNSIQGYDTGITLATAHRAEIRDNQGEALGLGIEIDRSARGLYRNNTFTDTDRAVTVRARSRRDANLDIDASNTANGLPFRHIVGARNLTIDGRDQQYSYLGLTEARNVTIRNLTMTGEGDGVYLADVEDVRLLDSTFGNNSASVRIGRSDRVTLRGNIFHADAGGAFPVIAFDAWDLFGVPGPADPTGLRIVENTFRPSDDPDRADAELEGIALGALHDTVVARNSFRQMDDAVLDWLGSGTVVSDNAFRGGDVAVRVLASRDTRVEANTIRDHRFGVLEEPLQGWEFVPAPIRLLPPERQIVEHPSKDSRIVNNTITGTQIGIQANGTGVAIAGNTIGFDDLGVYVPGGERTTARIARNLVVGAGVLRPDETDRRWQATAILTENLSETTRVTNNTVRASLGGIGFADVAEDCSTAGTYVARDNHVTGSGVGFELVCGSGSDPEAGRHLLRRNRIVRNGIGLVYVRVDDPSPSSDTAGVVDARRNWWGAASGPTEPGEADGEGDPIRADGADPSAVAVHPWLESRSDRPIDVGVTVTPGDDRPLVGEPVPFEVETDDGSPVASTLRWSPDDAWLRPIEGGRFEETFRLDGAHDRIAAVRTVGGQVGMAEWTVTVREPEAGEEIAVLGPLVRAHRDGFFVVEGETVRLRASLDRDHSRVDDVRFYPKGPGNGSVAAAHSHDGIWVGPEVTYRERGTHEAVLEVTFDSGETVVRSRRLDVRANRAPTARLEMPARVDQAPARVPTDGTATQDPDGHPLTGIYELPGNDLRTFPAPVWRPPAVSWTPPGPGTYTARLRVDDPFGGSAEAAATVAVDDALGVSIDDLWSGGVTDRAILEGRVVDETGAGRSGVEVSVTAEHVDSGVASTTMVVTGEDGGFRVRVPYDVGAGQDGANLPGEHTLTVTASAPNRANLEPDPGPTETDTVTRRYSVGL